MQVLPLLYEPTQTLYNRLIVEPQKIPMTVTDSGLITPERENSFCEVGIVFSACEGSIFKKGDEVCYDKIDRSSGEHLDTISVNQSNYDVIFENEVWALNEKPHNRIFIEPLSEFEITEGGLELPAGAKGITQKGVVFLAPDNFDVKTGDTVEYRKQEQGMYPTVLLDGVVYEVLFESDIFTINDKVAPYRMIVKIDLMAQAIKRRTTDTGLVVSPLFAGMLYNLQYGEVIQIGSEAQKMYAELHVGDTAILHHTIEYQPYRLLKQEFGKHESPIYEYRMINCWEAKAREIFGKLKFNAETRKIIDIIPLNDNIFTKWEFNLFEGTPRYGNLLLSDDNDLNQYHNVNDLNNVLSHKKKEAAEKAKIKISGIKIQMSQLNPYTQKNRLDELDSEFRTMQREETAISQYLRKNYLAVCQVIYPHQLPSYIICPYKQLYPINLLGKKYLIAHPDFIIAKTNTNMNISIDNIMPLGKNVFILPLEESQESELLIPDSAKEKPQKGRVVLIEGHDKVSKGDIILYRKSAGMEQDVDGVLHLILQHSDLIAKV